MVRRRYDSILIVEKEKKHAWSERDKVKAEQERVQGALYENEKALVNVILERNTLKVHVARIRALMAQAREKAIQEYKANFKDTDNYLDLMRDATTEYKESLKRVDPNFDADHYDRLILGEPQTPAPEDQVGFD